MRRRLTAIIIKEFLQLLRDPRTLIMALIMPVVMLLLFGYAITTDVENLPTVVFDQSQSQESRALVRRFANSRYFAIIGPVGSLADIEREIDYARARVGIVIPPDYADAIQSGRTARVQVIVDASDPLVARSALATADAIGQVTSLQIVTRRLQRSGVPSVSMPLEMRVRAWYNPDLRNVNFMVPGLLAVVLSLLTLMLTAIAIVRERELGTLEQLVATPIRKGELMLGKILPYVLLGYVDITLALLIAVYWFRVPVRGSLLLLYGLALIFYMATLGQGVLISTVSRTQRQAMQGAFFVFLPTILLSGFMFPREGMPVVIQWIGYAIPLTYFLIIVRGIIMKGVGFVELSGQIVPLAILGLIFFIVSVARFQKRLD